MSGLTHLEKQKLERELGMGSGYVLNFTNRTFSEFFSEVVGIDIDEPRFAIGSGSKANKMRAFWKAATDDQLRLLCTGLLDGWDLYSGCPMPESARLLLRGLLARFGGRATQPDPHSVSFQVLTDAQSTNLMEHLTRLTALPPQQRGYEFEAFLRDLFDAYGLSAKAAFRQVGEQIDGSFVLDNETYLLEAKWRYAQTGAADLHTFEGKLGEKAAWSRGLFVSMSGFSSEGLQAFGRGKRIVCMDGFDLSEMLRLRLTFSWVMQAKVRAAAETGNPFVSVRELPNA